MCREFRDQLKLTPYRPSKEINQLPFKEQIDKAQQEGLKTIALSRVEVLLHLFSGILTRAQNDALISDNPCSSIKVEVPNVTRERAPEFTDAEMNTLFDSGLFTGDIRPVRANYGEAIYWVPVLLAYTGARLEEISQLFLRDVEQKDGQWVIHIRDWDESQSVKTGKSRVVPLHPHLLELGFERFLATRATEGPLFSELKVSKSTGRYSDKLGKWLGEQIRQILGLKTGSISPLHAFRHTFVTHMRDLDIREDIQNAITGHSQGTSVGRRYGSFRQLHNAIAKMPRWPVPVWHPFSVDDVPTAEAEVQS
ncbi:site-specific integrase [Aeromonas veronii]